MLELFIIEDSAILVNFYGDIPLGPVSLDKILILAFLQTIHWIKLLYLK